MKIFSLNNYVQFLPFILVSVFTGGCHHNKAELYKNEIDSIGINLVPDLREGIFEVSLHSNGTGMVLKGETDVPEAKVAITGFLKNKSIAYTDSLVVLPDTNVIKESWGLVNVSVCNIRLFSSYDAEMVSQALMGTPVKILKNDGDWILIQTPDMYLGWVDSEAIEPKTTEEHNVWRSSPRIFYLKKTGDIFASPEADKVISDIVAGCIAGIAGETRDLYEVLLPDGRKGFIKKEEAMPFAGVSPGALLKTGNLAAVAESFTGIPYLWGGTSPKGFDCSGFVKIIYYLNGIILSRDASQQFRYGIRVRRTNYPDSLKTGDLLFFGSSRNGRPRATHVGMYLGNSEFIHASGMIKVNSLDSNRANFSRFRRDTFLGVRRIIGAQTGKGLQPVSEHNWYK